ncbi:MAG: tyrosine--tRNA ligase, partial [Parcubacteria group bacterium]|nr:tyrosine--tRNA ligase [Parcubacteria group bacterium]
VMVRADLTIIGSDQLFNEMMGRYYQVKFGHEPQVVITTTITPGLDGREKQSKSLGNYVGLADTPREKFGKIMTIPDALIPDYFRVYTTIPLPMVDRYRQRLTHEPMECKLALAEAIVQRYHGDTVAHRERTWFTQTFRKRETPTDVQKIFLGKQTAAVFEIVRACYPPTLRSNSAIRRLIQQNAVEVDGDIVHDEHTELAIPPRGVILKVGKRHWFQIVPSHEDDPS